MPEKNKLVRRLIRRGIVGHFLIGLAIFGPARTLDFWQAWVLMALYIVSGIHLASYFLKHDPQLLERRLLRKETIPAQRAIIGLWRLVAGASFIVAGRDHRLGYSVVLCGGVPLWLECLSFLLVVCGQVLFFQVMKANSYGAAVIQVESGQRVITHGLYRIVRHPMYDAFALMGVFSPLALGSFIGLAIALLLIPIIVWRLLNEEKVLRRDLPGYEDYFRAVPYRLIPHVW